MPTKPSSLNIPAGGSGLWPRALAGLAVVVAIGGVAYGAWFALKGQSQNGAQATAKQFIADLNAGDTTAAYDLTSATARQDLSAADFATSFNDLTAKDPIYDKETIAVTNNQAVYSTVLTGFTHTRTGRTQGTFTIGLVQTDGSWRVDSVSVD